MCQIKGIKYIKLALSSFENHWLKHNAVVTFQAETDREKYGEKYCLHHLTCLAATSNPIGVECFITQAAVFVRTTNWSRTDIAERTEFNDIMLKMLKNNIKLHKFSRIIFGSFVRRNILSTWVYPESKNPYTLIKLSKSFTRAFDLFASISVDFKVSILLKI